MAAKFYTAIVSDNADPDELGRLRVICPEIFGDAETEIPAWIAPRVAAGAGAGSGWWFIPAVDAIVFLERDPSGGLRWSGSTWGQVNEPPAFLAGNYPRRSGFTSPEGGHAVALDEDTGLLVLVTDPGDPDGVANYMSLDGDAGEFKIGLASGALVTVNGTQVVLMTPAGDTLAIDTDNGITLINADGTEYLALSSGVAALAGADVQITGGSFTATADATTFTSDPLGLAPTEPLILGTTFLTDLSTFLNACVGDVAMSPGVAAGAGVLVALITTALAAGAPHLSSITATE